MPDAPLVFFSYARSDWEIVRAVAEEVRARGVDVWIDVDNLRPGQLWESAISTALERIRALVVFLSKTSSTSRWVIGEVSGAARQGAVIIPILLERLDESAMPRELAMYQWLDVSGLQPQDAASRAADAIALALAAAPDRSVAEAARSVDADQLAQALAAESRGVLQEPASVPDAPPDSVFVVHGHDDAFLRQVVDFVESLGVKAIVMKEIGGASTSLLEKFLQYGMRARYAIVLLSGDDFGAARFQFEEQGVGERALQYRSRQNVILELGFFYGSLGWENVFVLERSPPKVFPNFERPSDLGGALFDRYDESGRWRTELRDRLKAHGFKLPPRTVAAG